MVLILKMSIRERYDSYGVDSFYLSHADTYSNPHQARVIALLEHLKKEYTFESLCDLACGDGLVTKHLPVSGHAYGVDKYLYDLYAKETGKHCVPIDFKDMINCPFRKSDVVVISYAVDLIPRDIFQAMLYNLAICFKHMVVIRPNKKFIYSDYFSLEHTKLEGQTQMTVYKSIF